MVESLSAALRESQQPDAASLLQIQSLTEQVDELMEEVRRLQAGQEFDRRLLEVASDAEDAR
jgi:hypothetical protein